MGSVMAFSCITVLTSPIVFPTAITNTPFTSLKGAQLPLSYIDIYMKMRDKSTISSPVSPLLSFRALPLIFMNKLKIQIIQYDYPLSENYMGPEVFHISEFSIFGTSACA